MSKDREESLQDLNMKVPTEWHTVIKVASARVGIPIRAFLLIGAARILDSIASDPVIRSVIPATNAWPPHSEEKLRAFCASVPQEDDPASKTEETSAITDAVGVAARTTIATTLPERLTQLVKRHVEQGSSISQIAIELGYDTPRLLEMFLQGRARVPLDKAHLLARILGVNPARLFRDVLHQYWPADEETLDAVLGGPVTDEEQEILRRIRCLHSSKARRDT